MSLPELQKEALLSWKVGTLANRWNHLEVWLTYLFAEITGCGSTFSFAILNSIVNFKSKLDAIDTAYNISFKNDQNKIDEWRIIHKRITKIAAKRNKIIHNIQFIEDNEIKIGNPLDVIARGKNASNWSIADIDVCIKEITHMESEVRGLVHGVKEHLSHMHLSRLLLRHHDEGWKIPSLDEALKNQ